MDSGTELPISDRAVSESPQPGMQQICRGRAEAPQAFWAGAPACSVKLPRVCLIPTRNHWVLRIPLS